MIGLVAPSSRVPRIELKLGVEKLRRAGLPLKVHPQCAKSFRYFAGSDEDRAQAILDYAADPNIEIIWCARGGYGAARLLPLLEKQSRRKISRGKLLIGYSDSTALFDFVRKRWGWSVLHASMPGLRSFLQVTPEEWRSLLAFVRKSPLDRPWGDLRLKHVGGTKPRSVIEGEVIGGNLAVWSSLAGSPYFPQAKGRILFFEEVSEYPYRIDRMITQIELAGGFDGVKAIMLGDFLDCKDSAPKSLKKMPARGFLDPLLKKPKPEDLAPLRKTLNEKKLIPELFAEIGERHRIPVFAGFPGGHGPGHHSLPIGGHYSLTPAGKLELLDWEWLR
jgi:muramoyltetrapeptide carboxypeptidase